MWRWGLQKSSASADTAAVSTLERPAVRPQPTSTARPIAWAPRWTGEGPRFVDELVGWLLAVGRRTYDGKATLLERSLRTAALARIHGARESQVVAALLHDVGHPLGDVVDASVSARTAQERLGATWLARVYPEAITEPIRLHVEAKRWLVAFEPGYAATLSLGSRASLEEQGGPMRPEERSVFESEPFAASALCLRRWVEEAPTWSGELPLLETFRPALLRQLRGAR